MALKKPSSSEDEYIAREEAKRKELSRLRREARERMDRRGRETCPVCDGELVEEMFRNVLIDRCADCGGVWLDAGELEKISTDDAGIVRAFFNFFAGRSGS